MLTDALFINHNTLRYAHFFILHSTVEGQRLVPTKHARVNPNLNHIHCMFHNKLRVSILQSTLVSHLNSNIAGFSAAILFATDAMCGCCAIPLPVAIRVVLGGNHRNLRTTDPTAMEQFI